MLAGLAFCEMLSQYPQSAFRGLPGVARGGSAAVCDPNPPHPFARYRFSGPNQVETRSKSDLGEGVRSGSGPEGRCR